MKYALIGCGRIAVNHIKAFRNNELELVALCDHSLDHIAVLLENCDILYTNFHWLDNYKVDYKVDLTKVFNADIKEPINIASVTYEVE